MKEQDKAFSSIDFVGQCLVDKERTSTFNKIINKVVSKGDTILDLGTGSGILALIAAKARAKKVYAVEFDSFVAEIAKEVVKANKLSKRISVLVEDARYLHFPKKTKFDIVISEMLTTGIVDEDQVQSINNLHKKGLVDGSTIFLPTRHDTYISLVNGDFNILGFRIPIILHLWRWHKWSQLKLRKITNELLLNSVDFSKENNEKFNTILTFEAKASGNINGIYLTSKTFLTDKIKIEDTEALNAPMLIPIPEKSVKFGQKIKLKVSYIFGGTYKNFFAKIIT